jgi:AcrR family transcriptional regulator
MDRRRASVERTRGRIVEATMALHAERGIFGTSWRDIAERADVSVATVYKHFPTLAELVPACGERVARISRPPTPDDVERTFRGARRLEERLSRLVAVFFDFYERGEPYLEVDARERQLAEVREWEASLRDLRERFVGEALRPLDPDEATVRAVAALLDFPVYRSFRRQEVTKGAAAAALHGMLSCWLAGTRSGDGGR